MSGFVQSMRIKNKVGKNGNRMITEMPAKAPKTKIVKVDLNEFKKTLSKQQQNDLLLTLAARFEQNSQRHKGISWSDVQTRLEGNLSKLQALNAMEITGGEPDVIDYDKKNNEFIFYDCTAESPTGRRNVVYDSEAQQSREKKGVFPAGNVLDIAEAMGIALLTEDQYRELQKLGEFDLKTSSWVETPSEIRKLGGALFCDRRYDHLFTYHNGANSFYGARGFRGLLRV